MKKFIAVFVVFALFGTALFAQEATGVKVTGWGRAIFEPLKIVKPDKPAEGADDFDVGASVGYSWYRGAAVGVSLSGSAEKIGFNLDYRASDAGTNWTTADNAYLWVKPISFLTIGAGKFAGPADNGLRGKIGQFSGSGFPALFGKNSEASGGISFGDEDTIFRRFKQKDDHAGGVVVLTPVEGLVIGAVFNVKVADSFDKDAYKKFQIGAGYTIPNIGLIRAQFLGGPGAGSEETTKTYNLVETVPNDNGTSEKVEKTVKETIVSAVAGDANKIQAAFALTAIEGLTLDIGGKIPLSYTDDADKKTQEAIGVSAGASFAAGDFTIGGRVDTNFGGYTEPKNGKKSADGFDLTALVEPSYNLGAFVVAADVGVQFTAKDSEDGNEKDNTGGLKLGLGAWLGLNLGNGNMRVGVAAKIPTEYDGKKTPLVVSLPIIMQYSF